MAMSSMGMRSANYYREYKRAALVDCTKYVVLMMGFCALPLFFAAACACYSNTEPISAKHVPIKQHLEHVFSQHRVVLTKIHKISTKFIDHKSSSSCNELNSGEIICDLRSPHIEFDNLKMVSASFRVEMRNPDLGCWKTKFDLWEWTANRDQHNES